MNSSWRLVAALVLDLWLFSTVMPYAPENILNVPVGEYISNI